MAFVFGVVSNPPHLEVDFARAAELLGLASAELRMKANFPAPEIWLAFPDETQASDATGSLLDTGLRAKVVSGSSLLELPGPKPVFSFAFTDTEFVAQVQDGEIRLPYDAPTLGVFCKPPHGYGLGSAQSSQPSWGRRSTLVLLDRVTGSGHERGHPGEAGALDQMATIDLYASVQGEISRVSIIRELADFSGLGDLKKPASDSNMLVCLSECERLFTDFTLDRRLENVRPRQRPGVGGARPEHEGRKLYSFGTRSLHDLLGSVSPDLKDISQFELGSRLSFVMNSQAEGRPASDPQEPPA